MATELCPVPGLPGARAARRRAELLRAVQEHNVLPLTSRCNTACVFCSHRQNPPGVHTYYLPPLDWSQIAECLAFLDGARPVAIGEAATRLREGEPLTHPLLLRTLRELRHRFPATPVRLTTNGLALSRVLARELAALQPLEVTVSLNSASPAGRWSLMRDPEPQRALRALDCLREAGLPWHGSVVAMPHLVGWEDLGETLRLLAEAGALTIRVFRPGFTRLAPPELRYPPGLEGRLRDFLAEAAERLDVPMLPEPPRLAGLAAEVAGVLPGSPAARAGLARGDVIEAVDGRPARSRVEAFRMARAAGAPRVRFRRGGRVYEVKLAKQAGAPSGLVMEFDWEPASWERVEVALHRHAGTPGLALVSPAGLPVVRAALAAVAPASELAVAEAVSRFFGGSITAAGLLTVHDFREAYREYLAGGGPRPAWLLLPDAAFDAWGRDLTGRSYLEVGEEAGCPVELA